ncbi:MAG: YeeE/YedE family protein, partial [Geminicoccaceae bacterium]
MMRCVQMPIVLSGALLLFAGALYLGGDGWRFAALFVIGGLLGMSLYHASFGFTSAYR